MDETEFIRYLEKCRLKVRSAIIPSSAMFKLYGKKYAEKVLNSNRQKIFYKYLQPMKLSKEKYDLLKDIQNKTQAEILDIIQTDYDGYLKIIKLQVRKAQRDWHKAACHQRSYLVYKYLDYRNVYHIADLCNQRIIPIEMLIKEVFDLVFKYGELVPAKNYSEIDIDKKIVEKYKDSNFLRS